MKIRYIVGNNKGPLNNRNNNQFKTTKIIKIQTENKNDEKPINKNFTKNNINYYSNNIFNKNTNINIILSPQRHIHMSDVKKTNNQNLEIMEKKIINSRNNSNNKNKKTEKLQKNYGQICILIMTIL